MWDAPTPLTEQDRPPFPAGALPHPLGAFVEALAVATQTPAALPGMLALSVLAAAAAGRVAVSPRAGWVEPVNLFAVVALPPGSRKSGVFAEAVAPLAAFEREEVRRLAPAIAESQGRRKIAEQALGIVQAAAAKASPEAREDLERDADQQARRLADLDVPAHPRLLVDDCSPERLAGLLAEQGGRIAAMSPEGDLFDLMAGRYSKTGAANLGVFLKGHAGDELRVDRIGRPPEMIPRPALTVALAVQPEVVRGLAALPGFRGRGLLARFLYAVPESLIGTRAVASEPLPDALRTAYAVVVTALLRLPAGLDGDGHPAPVVLGLDAPAAAALLAFEEALEPRLGEFGDLGHVQDWGGKLAGAVARLAGLLHLAERAVAGDWRAPVGERSVRSAIALADGFLVPHALAAFAEMGADPVVDDAGHVLRWLERERKSKATRREIHQGLRGRFKRVSSLDPALALLVEHGYIREDEPPAPDPADPNPKPLPVKKPGRPASPSYRVNPLCGFRHAPANRQRPRVEA